MAASNLQILANIASAQKSAGPDTSAGRTRASLNALRHSLTSQIVVMPGDDLAAFQAFGREFFTDLQPSGALEIQLVQTVVDTQWRLNRFRAHEANLFALGHEEHASDIQTEDEAIQTALAGARTLRDNTDALKTLSLHEQRLNRLFQSTLKQFLGLRKDRREREQKEMCQIDKLRKAYKTLDRPFDAAEFGFVLTNDQIAAHSRIEDALDEAAHTGQAEEVRTPGKPSRSNESS